MKTCILKFETTKDIEILYKHILIRASSIDAIITGDYRRGQFHATIMGSTYIGNYISLNNKIEIFITKKPFFISCNFIELLIKNYLAN